MTRKIDRAVELRVGDVKISNITDTGPSDILGISFSVNRSTNRNNNKAQITVINLSQRTRSSLSLDGKIPVSLAAGYLSDAVSLIFQGDVNFSSITNDGTDWKALFETGDGATASKKARVRKSFKTAKPGDLLRECGEALRAEGIGLGNLQDKINEGGIVPGLNSFLSGVVLDGRAVDVMTDVVTSLGYEWSIQDEQIQILRPDEVNNDTRLVISRNTGLIGSPQTGKKGLVRFRMLLDGRARPGGPITRDSENVNGDLRIEKIGHVGDTWGSDWFSDVEAKPTKRAA